MTTLDGLGSADGDDGLMSEINVTPLVDVVLVLLFIFMVTAPMLTFSVDVSLPEVSVATLAPEDAVVLTIDADGGLAVDGSIVTLADAVAISQARLAASPGGAVLLRADEGVPYGYVMSVLDALRREGISEVSLPVERFPEADRP